MKVSYNSPLVLGYTFLSLAVLILNSTLVPGLMEALFVVGPRGSFDFGDFWDYVRLVSHGLGHANVEHFVGNFTVLLMIGPILEEKLGTRNLFIVVLVTLLVTGILNVLFFPTGLLGASGVVYAFILLGSFSGARPGTVPLTFLLVAFLFLGEEVFRMFGPSDGVSHTAHLLGGVTGSVFGFRHLNAKASTTA